MVKRLRYLDTWFTNNNMKNDNIKPDLLQVSTVTRSGMHSKTTLKGVAYLTVSKGFNTLASQIAVEVTHSTGVGILRTLHEHTHALINITFSDKSVWSGTFAELRNELFPNTTNLADVQLTIDGESVTLKEFIEANREYIDPKDMQMILKLDVGYSYVIHLGAGGDRVITRIL